MTLWNARCNDKDLNILTPVSTCFDLSHVPYIKFSRYRPGVAQRVGRGILYSSMTAALEGGEWSAAHPGRTLRPGKSRYPFYRRLGGPKGRFGRAENLLPTGIRSRTVQPVVSSYTDWATRPTCTIYTPREMVLRVPNPLWTLHSV